MLVEEIVNVQKKFFRTGTTRKIEYRLNSLQILKDGIHRMMPEIYAALKKDLGKCETESYMAEVGMTLAELSYMEKHIKRFSARKKVRTPLAQFPAVSYREPEPYGTVLIMSPWNYPFMLTMEPVIDALAAGNTVVIKPSAYAPETSKVIAQLIRQCFSVKLAAVVEGGRNENQELLEQDFDYIFFTGGKTVGRLVMEKASAHLTPVTLELGGKSPCIVCDSANLKMAARRIVFGKYLNVGQTCVAPDYLLVQESVKMPLLKHIRKEIIRQWGKEPLLNEEYGRIINQKHFERLTGLIRDKKCLIGGKDDGVDKIEPTVVDNVPMDDPLMQDEIFGPILPVLTFKDVDEVQEIVERNPTPLALYLFTSNKRDIRRIMNRIRFGGGCVNDTIIHLATSRMGFGGTGQSGMGSYHGKDGFDTFSHYKSVVDKKTWLDLPFRYHPFSHWKDKMITKFLK